MDVRPLAGLDAAKDVVGHVIQIVLLVGGHVRLCAE